MLVKKVELLIFKRRWRKYNRHNFTTAANFFDATKVKVGKGTYGPLDVYNNGEGHLTIGCWCSIAPGATFLVSDEHCLSRITTFPFESIFRFRMGGGGRLFKRGHCN